MKKQLTSCLICKWSIMLTWDLLVQLQGWFPSMHTHYAWVLLEKNFKFRFLGYLKTWVVKVLPPHRNLVLRFKVRHTFQRGRGKASEVLTLSPKWLLIQYGCSTEPCT